MKKTQKIAWIFLWFLALSTLSYALPIITYEWINSDANTSDNDRWVFNVSNVEIYNREEAPGAHMWNINWIINSELFWDFVWSLPTSPISLNLMESSLTTCWTGWKTYTISWTIESEFFWDMNTVSSIYCPDKPLWENVELTFNSILLWNKRVSWALTWAVVANIFDKQQVAIIWSTSIKWDLSWLESEDGNTEINTIDASNLDKSKIWANINKNISLLTRNIPPSTLTNLNNLAWWQNLVWWKYFYYNYEWTTDSFNTYWNNWKTLQIWNTPFNELNPSSYKIEITWKNTIIVKWWNVYINADLANTNSNSMLTIVAKRDSNNNWWNIYIDPDVTNIDAILIADWSLLSYNWTSILNRNDSGLNWELSRQLYIYGSLFTKNVIGTEKAPYGTDRYISWAWDFTWVNGKDDNIYNLANMRQFQTRYASESPDVNVCGWTDKTLWTWWYSGVANLSEIKTYAWAWKMKCFNPKVNSSVPSSVSTPVTNLRTTWRTESIVIEYNPRLQLDIPYILRKN